MKFSQFKYNHIVTEWVDTTNPKKTTEHNYIRALEIYTKFTGKSPGQLITEAEKEIKTGLLPRERTVKRDLLGFRRYLRIKNSLLYLYSSILKRRK